MVRQKVMSEEQYLTSKGVGGALSDVMTDKIRAARQKNTSRGQERFERQNKKAIDNYYARREQARREYQRLVSTGKVRKPTETEKLISTAHGQSENRQEYRKLWPLGWIAVPVIILGGEIIVMGRSARWC